MTTAVTFAIVYSICTLAFVLFPEPTLELFNAWFHGLDLGMLKPAGSPGFTIGDYAYGLIGVSVTAFVTGTLFAGINNFWKN